MIELIRKCETPEQRMVDLNERAVGEVVHRFGNFREFKNQSEENFPENFKNRGTIHEFYPRALSLPSLFFD